MKVTFTGSRPAPQPRLVPKPEPIDHIPLTDEEIIELSGWAEAGMDQATSDNFDRMELIFAKVRALKEKTP